MEKDNEKILKALSNKRRLAVIKSLSQKKNLNVSDIAREIKLSFKSTSRHLRVLVLAGILDREQDGLQARYSLDQGMPTTAKKIIHLLLN